MKNPQISPLWFALLTMAGTVAVGEEATSVSPPRSQLQPMQLPKLLRVLPDCPANWVMKRSQARTLYQDHLEAHAIREYEKISPAGGTQSGKEVPKPETVVLAIRDTCGIGPHLEPFQKENTPPPGGDFKMREWNDYRGMLVSLGNNRTAFRILVGDRFLVEVVSFGDDVKTHNKWLEATNLKALTQTGNENRITMSEPVWIDFVDELHQERSRRYPVKSESEKADGPIPGIDLTIPWKIEEGDETDKRPSK